ncbi:hypothetical protein BTUL_0053g00020 [Botrytis tulipae]|uniref:Carrier domain-containing protein n=1 Tax=Botrytis tulipae TaxID=87230 RepID=A0A4Z1EV86_9HELO|nr:hypothetical protein BTUL_0053g00020 [Botrytis tulipae]
MFQDVINYSTNLVSAATEIVIITALSGLVILLTISYVIYQTKFHPLARYPGPLLAKFSSIYAAYHTICGTMHTNLYDLHQKHGEFVRFGPDHISINSASALEQIYNHKANVQKSSWYRVFYGLSIFNIVDKEVHARKKRVMTQAFSDQAVRTMEPHISSAIRDWCTGLGARDDLSSSSTSASHSKELRPGDWSSPKDMAHWAAYMIFDSLGEICFGKTFNTSLSHENRFFLDLMAADRRDIVYYLQQARDPDTGEGYSEAELMSETTLLLGAGSNTANSALTSIFYFLSQHPFIREKLTTIIHSTFPDVESISHGPALNSMVYLRACIDESMRLCPPVPMPLPREVIPGGLRVNGHQFQVGTIVGVPTYSLHHSAQHFDQPYVDDPTRWLIKGSKGIDENDGRTQEEVSKAREAFAPFSLGPRECIGRSVASYELQVGVARVLWLYNMRIAAGCEKIGVGRHGEVFEEITPTYIPTRSPDAPEFVKKLESRGVFVATPACDISNNEELKKVLAVSTKQMPPIKGCIQACMVLQDEMFEKMSYSQWEAALKPKVDGSWNLHTLLLEAMDFFVLLSSVSGIFGQSGQANYAAANTYLDALSHYRVAQGQKAISIDLGVMISGGFLVENPKILERMLSHGSMLPITRDNLNAILDYYCNPSLPILSARECQTVVGINTSRNIRMMGRDEPSWLQQPIFSALGLLPETYGAVDALSTDARDFRAEFLAASSLVDAGAIVSRALVVKLARSLSNIPSDIDLRTPIHSLGVDSLLAVELRTWIASQFQADIAIFEISSGASFAGLGMSVASKSSRRKSEWVQNS